LPTSSDYAEQLQAIDTTGVPATAHVSATAGVERA
jgi:Asp-tRNA(Asn)/Glu-tRNA(Gln) amidotransferase C subunit